MSSEISVVIFEDNEELRESLFLLINGFEGFRVTGRFSNCEGIKGIIERLQPDVVLMDIDMPVFDGLEGLKFIKSRQSPPRVVMLTVFEDSETVFESLRYGADGYLLKKTSPAEIIKAIEEVTTGGAPMTPPIARKVLAWFSSHGQKNKNSELTPREKEVLNLLVEGFSYKMIAYELEVSLDTIRSHIRAIYSKLQVHSVSQAVTKAIKDKLI